MNAAEVATEISKLMLPMEPEFFIPSVHLHIKTAGNI